MTTFQLGVICGLLIGGCIGSLAAFLACGILGAA